MARKNEESEKPQAGFKTMSGIEIERVYNSPDTPDRDRLGAPGEFPYTRGIRPSMYRGQFWTMRQYAGFGSAAETNLRFKYLLENGQTGLSVAFDLPTQMGMDSDHALAAGEVGRVGVAIDTLDDMETLFDGIPLDQVSTSMTINSTAPVLLAFYIAVASRQGHTPDKLRGTVQNDILKEYIARGTQVFPPRSSIRLVVDVVEYCQREVPHWNTISISGYHMREAGSTAVQEVAFTFLNAITYVEAALARGMDIDSFAPQLSFFFSAHNEWLEEIAKFRAARRLWARIVRDRFKAREKRSMMLRFHAQTAGSALTGQFPDGNVARVTLQALAAVLGGAQSIHTNSKDEALALPSEEAARLALRTQQVIAYESGVGNTVDPAGGAFAIEALTDQIEQQVLGYIDTVESRGGMLAAIESGFVQREIQEAAYAFQQDIESGKRIIVGINQYGSDEEEQTGERIPLHRIDPTVEAKQVVRLNQIRAQRRQEDLDEALSRLKAAAQGDENLMPFIIDAIRVHASVGEVSDTLRTVFGEYREV